jgi:hypothetical protein
LQTYTVTVTLDPDWVSSGKAFLFQTWTATNGAQSLPGNIYYGCSTYFNLAPNLTTFLITVPCAILFMLFVLRPQYHEIVQMEKETNFFGAKKNGESKAGITLPFVFTQLLLLLLLNYFLLLTVYYFMIICFCVDCRFP